MLKEYAMQTLNTINELDGYSLVPNSFKTSERIDPETDDILEKIIKYRITGPRETIFFFKFSTILDGSEHYLIRVTIEAQDPQHYHRNYDDDHQIPHFLPRELTYAFDAVELMETPLKSQYISNFLIHTFMQQHSTPCHIKLDSISDKKQIEQ